jgi:hypothetical protein
LGVELVVQWYKSNQKLFRQEKESVASRYPSLTLEILGPGTAINKYVSLKTERAVAYGVYHLLIPSTDQEIGYSIAVCLRDAYPREVPVMFCNDPKLPLDIDRHILNDGRACLGVTAEVQHKWTSAPNIVSFLDELVAPFLAWQVYYDAYECPPTWDQRSHGKKGIWEFYAEILGLETSANIEGFMDLLARKNTPGGHELCPCGSGQRLRSCHRGAVCAAREKVNWQDVKIDLDLLKRSEISKEL